MKLGAVEGLGVEAKLIRQQDGGTGLGIYCARCSSGIVMVVLAANGLSPEPEFDWQSDEDVLHAIRSHRKKHESPAA